MSKPSMIKIINQMDNTLLATFALEEENKAYEQLHEYEELGLDVHIIVPSPVQTLANSLGVKGSELQDFNKSMEEEIEEHDGCVFCEPDQKK